MDLPATIEEFKAKFPVSSFSAWELEKGKYSSQIQNMGTYCGRALLIGRPLNKVIIMMAGKSGSGKSSIINTFFDDKRLCPTNSVRSETAAVYEIKKSLTIQSLGVKGDLVIVDVPHGWVLLTSISKKRLLILQ